MRRLSYWIPGLCAALLLALWAAGQARTLGLYLGQLLAFEQDRSHFAVGLGNDLHCHGTNASWVRGVAWPRDIYIHDSLFQSVVEVGSFQSPPRRWTVYPPPDAQPIEAARGYVMAVQSWLPVTCLVAVQALVWWRRRPSRPPSLRASADR